MPCTALALALALAAVPPLTPAWALALALALAVPPAIGDLRSVEIIKGQTCPRVRVVK